MSYPPLQGAKAILLVIAIGMGTCLEVLDISITNIAIPSIAGEIGVTPYKGAWIISGYVIGSGTTILLSGWLARRFGEVKVFLTSACCFVLGSFACGLTNNFASLIAFRFFQGVSAGPLVPLSQSLLIANFPEKKHAAALAAWSLITAVAPIVGPVLGGWISDTLGWRWIFFVNIPIGCISAALTWSLLRKRETSTLKLPVDVIGIILLVIGIASLQIVLDKGNDLGWLQSHVIIGLASISVVSLSFFCVWTLTAKYPVVDLALFKRRNFAVISLCAIMAYIWFYGGFVIYPLWLQMEMNYDAIWAGFALMPFVVLLVPGTIIVKALITRGMDLRWLLSGSFVIFGISYLLATRYTTQASFHSLLPPRLLLGLALSMLSVPGIMIAMSGVETTRLANASSLLSFQRIFGIGLGASIGIAILEARTKVHFDHLLPTISHLNPITRQYLQTLDHAYDSQAAGFTYLHDQVMTQSYMLSMNDFFFLGALFFCVLCFLVWLTKPPFEQTTGGAH